MLISHKFQHVMPLSSIAIGLSHGCLVRPHPAGTHHQPCRNTIWPLNIGHSS
jgi:hypothetical protein